MKPEHLSLLRTPGLPSAHPVLPWAVVAISRPDLEADAYRSQLWRVSLTGKDPVLLTAGDADTDPAISPDGAWIAFLRRTETAGAGRDSKQPCGRARAPIHHTDLSP